MFFVEAHSMLRQSRVPLCASPTNPPLAGLMTFCSLPRPVLPGRSEDGERLRYETGVARRPDQQIRRSEVVLRVANSIYISTRPSPQDQ